MALSKLLTIASGRQTGHSNTASFALGGGQDVNEPTLTLTSSSHASAKPLIVFDSNGSTERFSVSKSGDVAISGDLAITGAITSVNTVTANTSFTGNVTLGDAVGDDVIITGSLASSIPVKTDNSFSIGAATKALLKVYSKTLTTQANGVADYLDISALALTAAGTSANIDITLTPKGTGSVVMGKVDINGGAIDGANLGAAAGVTLSGATVGASLTWSAAQNFTTGTTTIATADINGGAIDGATIGAAAAAAITGTAITGTSFSSTGAIELGVTADPGWADNKGYLYAKENGSDIDLYWRSDGDGTSATNDVRLTDAGNIAVSGISFSMADAYADGSAVNITGADVNFQVNGGDFYVQATNSGSNYYLKTTTNDLVLGTSAGSKGVNFDGKISSDMTFSSGADRTMLVGASVNAHANKLVLKGASATTDNGGNHHGGHLELHGGAAVGSGVAGVVKAVSQLQAEAGMLISAGSLDCNVASDFAGNMTVSSGNIAFGAQTQTFNTVAVQDFAASGMTPIQTFTAGSAVAIRKVVGLSADGKCDHVANNSADAASCILGISHGAANDTESVRVVTMRGAVVGGYSGLTVGAIQYLGTNGDLTETCPTSGGSMAYIVGRAVSASSVQLIGQMLYLN